MKRLKNSNHVILTVVIIIITILIIINYINLREKGITCEVISSAHGKEPVSDKWTIY